MDLPSITLAWYDYLFLVVGAIFLLIAGICYLIVGIVRLLMRFLRWFSPGRYGNAYPRARPDVRIRDLQYRPTAAYRFSSAQVTDTERGCSICGNPSLVYGRMVMCPRCGRPYHSNCLTWTISRGRFRCSCKHILPGGG